VIEATIENFETKVQILEQVDAWVRWDVIVASNTSSISPPVHPASPSAWQRHPTGSHPLPIDRQRSLSHFKTFQSLEKAHSEHRAVQIFRSLRQGRPRSRVIGENFYGPRALYTALQMKACDYVMPDFMRIGGVTGWQRAAAIAAAAGIPISTHLYPEVAAHVMRVSETAHWLEWQDWANPILQQPYEVKGGELLIPDVPGVGLEWDEKVVAAHLADNF